MNGDYAGRQVVGMDLHRQTTPGGRSSEWICTGTAACWSG